MRIRAIAVCLLIFTLFCTPLQAEKIVSTEKYVGQVTSVREEMLVDGRTKVIVLHGSCIAVNLGLEVKSGSDPNRRMLITAGHVVTGTNHAKIQIQGKDFEADVVLLDDKKDIAYLLASKEEIILESLPCPNLTYKFSENDSYTAIGYSGNNLNKVTGQIGVWKSFDLENDDTSQESTPTTPINGMSFLGICKEGMSGGGVFDSKGEIKGIIVAGNDARTVFMPWGRENGEKPPPLQNEINQPSAEKKVD